MEQSSTLSNSAQIWDSFRDPSLGKALLRRIEASAGRVTIMEVCGTHTVALFRSGIRYALPEEIRLVSGPGCPVCVTPMEVIDEALGLACKKKTVLFCFADMLKVPGSKMSLEEAKANYSAAVRIMYSPLEALQYAQDNPRVSVVLFGVGFETTVPLFASVLLRARSAKVRNLFLLTAFKLVPPALEAIMSSEGNRIDGFMLPGHVSAILGERAYRGLIAKFNISAVIAGFEPVDMLESIAILVEIISKKQPGLINQYSRCVNAQGNLRAKKITASIFKPTEAVWRGIGMINGSGLRLNEEFHQFDARRIIDFSVRKAPEPKGCLCAQVIKGKSTPLECKYFRSKCSPEHPIGPCMVSSEGTCAAYYKYGR